MYRRHRSDATKFFAALECVSAAIHRGGARQSGRETVIETIRLTVYPSGRPVQIGEVVVGVPDGR